MCERRERPRALGRALLDIRSDAKSPRVNLKSANLQVPGVVQLTVKGAACARESSRCKVDTSNFNVGYMKQGC